MSETIVGMDMPDPAAGGSPVLVAATHGTSDADGQASVEALADAVARRSAGESVRLCHVDVQAPDVPTTLAGLDPTRGAVIVPVLLSAGYHVRVDLREAADGAPADPECGGPAIAGALGPDSRLVDVLVRRLQSTGLIAQDEVILGAAGSSDSSAVEDCRRTAAMLGAVLGRSVEAGFLSAAEPRVADLVRQRREDAAARGGRVVVASYLLAPGFFHTRLDGCGADAVTAPLVDARLPEDAVPDELVGIVLDRWAAELREHVEAI